MKLNSTKFRGVLAARSALVLLLGLAPFVAMAQEEAGRYGAADYHIIYNDPSTEPPTPTDIPIDVGGANLSYRFNYTGPEGGSFYNANNWEFNATGRPGGTISGNPIVGTFNTKSPILVPDITRPDGTSAGPTANGYTHLHHITQYTVAIGNGTGVVFDPVGEGQSDTTYSVNVIYAGGLTGGLTQNGSLTIKSGTLEGRGTYYLSPDGTVVNRQPARFIVGRNNGANAEGKVIQTGGTYRQIAYPGTTSNFIQLGDSSSSTGGRGIYDYSGGIIDNANPGTTTQVGMLIGAGNDGTGKFIMRSPTAPGYVRTTHLLMSNATRTTGTLEFHYGAGGLRPFQVLDNLSLPNNGTAGSTRSSMIDLQLDAAPTLNAGVPLNLGLIDIDFNGDSVGGILGSSGGSKTGMRFYAIDGTTLLDEGATISATLGGNTYNWTLTYTGNISWTDADTSIVNSVTGPGTGKDIVLMGLSSVVEPSARPGDFNLDEDVDGDDLAAWNGGFGSGTTLAQGDADDDGDVDGSDFLTWQRNLGPAPGISSIPEPASATLLVLSLTIVALRTRSRR